MLLRHEAQHDLEIETMVKKGKDENVSGQGDNKEKAICQSTRRGSSGRLTAK
jgi:hypothetical protein